MSNFICVTCGEIVSDEDMFHWETHPTCPYGHDHQVLHVSEVSDIVNDYSRLLKELDDRLIND